jgi:uncharacterized protein with NAD-binding domain and iron-sulfur cluster
MSKEKIAILGGGVGSLVTAWELTRTTELREKYDVTVYQMGWRLGGKGATGRNLDPAKGLRIEEHGLHVWLGFYDNAFQVIQDVFAEVKARGLAPNSPFPDWTDAFKPQSFTPVGVGDGSIWLPVWWPTNDKPPGIHQGGVIEAIRDAVELLGGMIRLAFGQHPLRALCILWRMLLIRRAAGKLESDAALGNQPHLQTIHDHLNALATRFREIGTKPGDDGLIAALALEMLEMGLAIIRGFLNPAYGLLKDFDLNRIDGFEFMDWLVANGAPPSMKGTRSTNGLEAPRQPFLRALYDLAFAYRQYEDDAGNKLMAADFAAGAALRCCIRICTGYRGAVLYLMQAGMGEVVVGPLYQVLKDRGVKFEFFSKVKTLRLSENRNWVERIEIERQAAALSGAYDPLFEVKGLPCWPSEPFWDQLANGAALKAAGTNFESHWATYPPGYERPIETLVLGEHFDRVVLGMSLGAFKDFGNGEQSPCAELIAASPAFAAMTGNIGVVPTHAEQLWLTKDLAGLGWSDASPAMVGAVEPLDVWAAMAGSIPHEDWPVGDLPQSLHYFCGPLNTDAYTKPASDTAVPAQALAGVQARVQHWLENQTETIWPNAVTKGTNGIDWSLLYGGAANGPARLADQFLRANIDPTECCPGTWSGTTQYRLRPGDSGFVNLTLAGDWTRTGTNTACVESATMSGKAASRAICGSPADIPYLNFMQGGDWP